MWKIDINNHVDPRFVRTLCICTYIGNTLFFFCVQLRPNAPKLNLRDFTRSRVTKRVLHFAVCIRPLEYVRSTFDEFRTWSENANTRDWIAPCVISLKEQKQVGRRPAIYCLICSSIILHILNIFCSFFQFRTTYIPVPSI